MAWMASQLQITLRELASGGQVVVAGIAARRVAANAKLRSSFPFTVSIHHIAASAL
jgi:ClpP class serine protease